MELQKRDVVVTEIVLHVGRPFEVLSMADYLKSQGYNVGCILHRNGDSAFTLREYLNQAHFHHLLPDDFALVDEKSALPLIKEIAPRFVIGPWYSAQDCPSTIPFFAWCLQPHDKLAAVGEDMHILTNSYTTRKKLYGHRKGFDPERGIKVLISPIDYSLFREYARPWIQRENDLVSVSRVGERDERKNTHLYKEFDNMVSITDEKKLVMDRKMIAEAMGNAKIALHLSQVESASLVAYEAMNAGCYPLFYKAGAALEQLGSEQFLVERIDIPYLNERINQILHLDFDNKAIMERGKQFDRVTVGKAFVDYIEQEVSRR